MKLNCLRKKKETHLTALDKIQWCSHQAGKLPIFLFKSETSMQEFTFDNISIKRFNECTGRDQKIRFI